MNASTTTKILKALSDLHALGLYLPTLRWPDQEFRDLWGDEEFFKELGTAYDALLRAEQLVEQGEALLKSMPEVDTGDDELDAQIQKTYLIFFDEFNDFRHTVGNHRLAMPAAREEIGDYLYEAKFIEGVEGGWLASVQGPFSLKNWDQGGAVFGVHPTPAAAIAAAKASGWKSPNEA